MDNLFREIYQYLTLTGWSLNGWYSQNTIPGTFEHPNLIGGLVDIVDLFFYNSEYHLFFSGKNSITCSFRKIRENSMMFYLGEISSVEDLEVLLISNNISLDIIRDKKIHQILE